MKRITFLIYIIFTVLILFPTKVLGQFESEEPFDNTTQFINAFHLIAYDELILSGDWKFSTKDSLVFAAPEYEDSHWERKNTVFFNIDSLSEDWNGIGWFRKSFTFDTSLVNFTIATTIYQRAATEIYIDGILWKRFGHVSANAENEYLYRNLEYFISPFKPGKTHTIAVRMSNHRVKTFLNNGTYAGFSIVLGQYDKLLFKDRETLLATQTHSTLLIAFAAAFMILHLMMFLFYPKNRVDLYYALSLIAYILAIFFESQTAFTTSTDILILYNRLSILCVLLFHLSFLRMTYHYANHKAGKLFYSIVLTYLIYIIYSWTIYINDTFAIVILNAIVYIDMIRLVFSSKSSKENNWIIGAGVITSIAIIVLILLSRLRIIPFFDGYYQVYYSIVPIIIAISINQAREYAINIELLEIRLMRIRSLSEKALEHERKEAEFKLQAERQKVAAQEAEYRAKVAELQSDNIMAEHNRKTKELEEARYLQLSMLPAKLPQHKGLSLKAKMKTATEVGGDFYDIRKLDTTSSLIAVGDATGHGLNAGTMVTTVKSLFHSLDENLSLVEMFWELTRVIRIMNFKKIYMSLTLIRIDGRKVEISSAGMPPVILYKKKTHTTEQIVLKGMPLGSVLNYPYQTWKSELEFGDILLCASDGLYETFNPDKQMFEIERTENILLNESDNDLNTVLNRVVEISNHFRGELTQRDDVTLFAIKAE